MKNLYALFPVVIWGWMGCVSPQGPAPAKKKAPVTPQSASTPSAAAAPPASAVAAHPASASALPVDPLVREVAEVEINGVTETWTLRWDSPPTPYCELPEDAMTCPCTGFGYGEMGSLSLIRARPGMPKERLLLDPMFADGSTSTPSSILVRSRYQEADGDFSREQMEEEVAKRKPVVIMDLKDYNHDGLAAEFVLQVSAGPCGHQQGVLLGVEAKGGPIKVFGGAANPTAPLVMEHDNWYQLLMKNSFDSLEFGCGDHGSDKEMVIHLSVKDGVFNAEQELFDCDGKDESRGTSILKKPL